MDQSDIDAVIATELSASERALLKSVGRSRPTLICAVVILLAVCFVWIKYHQYFAASRPFLIYNAIFDTALVWAAFWSYSHERRVHRLATKLLRTIAASCQG